MKFLIRWAIRLFIISIVLVVALVLLKDTLLKAFAEYRLRSRTGLDVRIGRLEAGLSSPRITLEDFKLYNSAEFGGSPLVSVPELHVECDATALAFRKLHCKLLRLHLSEVNIVESKDGRTNITMLMERLQAKGGQRPSDSSGAMGVEFQGIDLLNLTVGKVKYSSLRKPSKNLEFDVGLTNEVLTNVKSMEDLSGLLLKIVFRKGFNILSGNSASPVAQVPQLGQPVGRPKIARSEESSTLVVRKHSRTNGPARK
ncbi:MAG: hypothetical protein L0Z50_00940 [Verrucomicrobiales bacterium]|nr:hypothetical protein [Verrucomicrobiales bacterium]